MVGCAAAGLVVTQRTDRRMAVERLAALGQALDELRIVFGAADRFDAGQLQILADRAGLDDLRFDADLTADSSREVQSVHDGDGGILGWFSWKPDRAYLRTMNWLWGIVGTAGVILTLCAFIALRATRGSPARSRAISRPCAGWRPGTALPDSPTGA